MSRNLTSFVFRDWQSRKFVKVSTGLTNFVSTFLRKKKFPSQSSLAHKLMCSGFFYLPKVSERLPQPGCISIRLMYSGFFYLPPFKMIFNIKERKKERKKVSKKELPTAPRLHCFILDKASTKAPKAKTDSISVLPWGGLLSSVGRLNGSF